MFDTVLDEATLTMIARVRVEIGEVQAVLEAARVAMTADSPRAEERFIALLEEGDRRLRTAADHLANELRARLYPSHHGRL